MGCGCGGAAAGQGNGAQQQHMTYVHTKPTGEQESYSNETEVAAAVSRMGGTYRVAVPA